MKDTKALGYWHKDASGLPCFQYTGALPYAAQLPNGKAVKLPDDPWFLLGNYRMTLFTHVSGEVELISGQRAWARLNQGEGKNSGRNRAQLTVEAPNGEKTSIELVGMNSLAADPLFCRRVFGCGYARYSYNAGGLTVERCLSVKPSDTPYDGTSAYLATVTLKNTSDTLKQLTYLEGITANFTEIQYQSTPVEKRRVQFRTENVVDRGSNLAYVKSIAETNDPLLLADRDSMSICDGYPPALFLKAETKGVYASANDDELIACAEFTLQPGESKELIFVVGFAYGEIEDVLSSLTPPLQDAGASAFAADWQRVLPSFAQEQDETLQQELIWHAYVLEAMATYSEYYGETKIPQGTIYDYDWGAHASARDHYQHGLPLVYYNAPLAKSILRYMLKRTTPFGEIRLIEKGVGYGSNERYFVSDQQLFFFLLLSAYLRETGDYAFLAEATACFPPENGTNLTVLKLVERCYIFLRDEIGTGEHGLVRLLNSDWNDAVYYIVKAPYNNVLFTGESHMNTAMAICVLRELSAELEKAKAQLQKSESEQIDLLRSSMEVYRDALWKAFARDMGDRDFPRRMYFAGHAYGDDNMFLEPQGYALMIEEMPPERKQRLYAAMKQRLFAGEVLGAREQENPEFVDDEFDYGSRENGGFWWALNGPVILGVAQMDPSEAMRLLKQMTFANYIDHYPQYWSSYWSAADNVESCLIPEEGLPDQTSRYADIPVFCAHPHAWILYCYLNLTASRA